MIPAAFDYVRAESASDALELVREFGEGARLLAGGQSLLPMMKLRLAAPEMLVDIGDLAELRYIRREGDTVLIGAAARYADLLESDVIRQSLPLLGRAAATVGDAQIRYRGTVGGALAHADPAADIGCAALALDAEIVIRGLNGTRTVAVADFFVDYYETALEPGEMVAEIRVRATGAERCQYARFATQPHGWATVAVAVAGTRIAFAGMGATPLRARAAEDVLATGGDFAAAAELADHGTAPTSDRHADADYRRHLARILTLRTLTAAHAH